MKDFDKTFKRIRKHYGDDLTDTIVEKLVRNSKASFQNCLILVRGFFLEGLIMSAGALALNRVLKTHVRQWRKPERLFYEAELGAQVHRLCSSNTM